MAAARKRSVRIAGHSTSISLEPEFWHCLKEIAAARGVSLSELVGEIDSRRDGGDQGLSSALRVHVLNYFREPRARR